MSNYEDQYSHITDEERDKLRAEVSKTESWLQNESNKQAKLSKCVNPVLTADAIGKQRQALLAVSNPIVRKPKVTFSRLFRSPKDGSFINHSSCDLFFILF